MQIELFTSALILAKMSSEIAKVSNPKHEKGRECKEQAGGNQTRLYSEYFVVWEGCVESNKIQTMTKDSSDEQPSYFGKMSAKEKLA